jgi:poly-gamma-glutamate capsule biosynthesis protein CapA/YwtB (metallophosphatase superfamily)
VILLLLACGGYAVSVQVVDELGHPVASAETELAGALHEADAEGRILIRGLSQPELLLVRAEGFLDEPVVVGPAQDADVQITLLGAEGRTVVHAGGDVSLGRRYMELDEGTPLLAGDTQAQARALVADLAPAFAAADLRIVNLETVVGTLDEAQAYPAKRWLLQAHPDSLSALDELGVDLVVLANNHQRDWLDAGVSSTLDALEQQGLAWVGGGEDVESANTPQIADVDGVRVGVLAWTTVDGWYVNDNLDPDSTADDWQGEPRTWGSESLGVPVADRNIGSAWQVFQELREDLSEDDEALLWSSIQAVYPELQDWVARYDHGGANRWDDQSTAEITALAEQTDLVMVQLHSGYQFAGSPGSYTRQMAYESIDAGADIVIAHHPHVLQGFEFYKGKLIAWSLGNFIFDQDFLATWRGGWLRTVWEGDELIQARLMPMYLDRYRPVPITGYAARDVLARVASASLEGTTSTRGSDLRVRPVAAVLGEDSVQADLRFEHGTARVVPLERQGELHRFELDPVAEVDQGLVWRQDSTEGLQVGRDLWGLHGFEDEDTHLEDEGAQPTGWTWTSDSAELVQTRDGQGTVLQLHRSRYHEDTLKVWQLARIPIPEHNLYERITWAGQDGEASYSVRVRVRGEGDRDQALVHLALYDFDDLDPTSAPESTVLQEIELPIQPSGVGWSEHWLDLPAIETVDGLRPNMALLSIRQDPGWRDSTLQIDDVTLVEWRSAALEPEGWDDLRFLRNEDGEHSEVELMVLPW